MKRSATSRCFASSTMPIATGAAGSQRQILPHRHLWNDAFDLAILGAEAHAHLDRVDRLAEKRRLPSMVIGTGVRFGPAEKINARAHLGRPAEKAGESAILAGANRQADVLDFVPACSRSA